MQRPKEVTGLVWYTLLDPTTDQFFYACPATGACSWHPSTIGSILQGHLPDWWEMFDDATRRPYYFNNSTQETFWVLPKDLNVIPVPLSSEDDISLRNVLGPPPITNEPKYFTKKEVVETDVIDVSKVQVADGKSPVDAEATTAEWVALEDPRTGIPYFLNRQTMKLAWNRVEMLHQQISDHDQANNKANTPTSKIEAPTPVAFTIRASLDPDFTTDTWSAPTEPPPRPPIQTPFFSMGSVASSSSPVVEAKSTKDTKAPPNKMPAVVVSSHTNTPKLTNGLPTTPKNTTVNATQQTSNGKLQNSPKTTKGDPNIPAPPTSSTIPAKKPYRASIFIRPLPVPAASPKRGPPVSVSHAALGTKPMGSPPNKSSSASNLHNPPSDAVVSNNGNTSSSFNSLLKSSPPQSAKLSNQGSASSFSNKPGTNKPSGPPPTAPPMPPRLTSSVSSSKLPRLSKGSSTNRHLPSEPSHRSEPRPPSQSHPKAPTQLNPPNSANHTNNVNLANHPNQQASSRTSPAVSQKSFPRPPNGSFSSQGPHSPPSSPRTPHSGASPPSVSVIVTMERGRTGSRPGRSFRASISRVAPPTFAELSQASSQPHFASSAPNPSVVSTSSSAPIMVLTTPGPYVPPPATTGPTLPFMRSITQAPPVLRSITQTPSFSPTKSMVPSSSYGNVASSSSAPRSMPASQMDSRSGFATASKASSSKPAGRPVLVKSFTMNHHEQSFPGRPTITPDLKAQINFFQLEGFAAQYFKSTKKGLFRRAVPVRQRLTWTQAGMKQPLLKLKSDAVKKALLIFKNIQIFMGDRAIGTSDEEKYKLVEGIFENGLNIAQLRDEIFCQLCKQTTLNPNADSTLRGWMLICCMLQYFAPTKDLEHWFTDFCREHEKTNDSRVLAYVKFALKLLTTSTTGSTLRIPEPDEIKMALKSPLQPRLFGVTLSQVLESQKKHTAPSNAQAGMPYILTSLLAMIERLNGIQMEGIFRVPGSHKLCTKLRLQLEAGNYSGEGLLDPHVPASVLKWWLRDLEEPVIPPLLYPLCLEAARTSTPEVSCPAAFDKLPLLNRQVVISLIRFVQVLARPENMVSTKMAVGSLAIVFGPNLLRCQATDMNSVFEASRWEQIFVVNLINHLKTN